MSPRTPMLRAMVSTARPSRMSGFSIESERGSARPLPTEGALDEGAAAIAARTKSGPRVALRQVTQSLGDNVDAHELAPAPGQKLGDRPRRPRRHGLAVDAGHGQDAERGRSEERLLRQVDVEEWELARGHGDARRLRELEDGSPRHALQSHARPRGADGAVAHEEEVARAVLGHVPVDVEHEAVRLRVRGLRFQVGEDVIHAVRDLGARIEALRRRAPRRRGDHAGAAGDPLREGFEGNGEGIDDDSGLLALPDQTRDGADPAGDAPPDHGLAIGPVQRQVVFEHLARLLLHLVSGHVERHASVAAGAVESVDVLAQLEGPPAEGARRVVDSIAVLHAAVEDGDRRLALGNERAVEIDHALLHRCLLWADLRDSRSMLGARAASAHGVARVSQRSRRVQARVTLTPSEKSRLGKKRRAPVERYDIFHDRAALLATYSACHRGIHVALSLCSSTTHIFDSEEIRSWRRIATRRVMSIRAGISRAGSVPVSRVASSPGSRSRVTSPGREASSRVDSAPASRVAATIGVISRSGGRLADRSARQRGHTMKTLALATLLAFAPLVGTASAQTPRS